MKKLLFNPFEKYTEGTLLLTGVIFTLLGGLSAYGFNGRYDGALDFHLVEAVSIKDIAIDLTVAILSTSLLLWLAGKIINRKTRAVDIFTTVLIARSPLYLLPLFNIGNVLFNATEKIPQAVTPGNPDLYAANLPLILVFSLITLACAVWLFALLWNGYKTASNAKGVKSVLLFIVAVLVAETVSKVLLAYL